MTMTLKRSPHLGVGTYEASGTARNGRVFQVMIWQDPPGKWNGAVNGFAAALGKSSRKAAVEAVEAWTVKRYKSVVYR